MPPSVSDWLAKDHLVWFVIDAVGQIDLGSFYESYRSDGVGNTAFHPEMMVALLVYAYCNGKRLMRRGSDACRSEWSLICATHNLLKLWQSGIYVSAPSRTGKICMN